MCLFHCLTLQIKNNGAIQKSNQQHRDFQARDAQIAALKMYGRNFTGKTQLKTHDQR